MHTLLIKICTITFTIHVMLGFFKHFIFININYSDIYYFFLIGFLYFVYHCMPGRCYKVSVEPDNNTFLNYLKL